mgnify:CR=1 FL=1
MIAKFAIASVTAAVLALAAGQSANAQSAHGAGFKVQPSHTSATMNSQRAPAQTANIPSAPTVRVPSASMTPPPVVAPTGLPARVVPAVSTPSSVPAIQQIRR